MPRLKNRLQERFGWLIAKGMDRKAAYAKLCPHVADPATMGYKLYHRNHPNPPRERLRRGMVV